MGVVTHRLRNTILGDYTSPSSARQETAAAAPGPTVSHCPPITLSFLPDSVVPVNTGQHLMITAIGKDTRLHNLGDQYFSHVIVGSLL